MLILKRSSLCLFFYSLFIFFTLSLYSGGFTDHLVFGQGYGEDLSDTPKIINSLLKFPLYIFTAYLMFKNWPLLRKALSDTKYFLIFCLFCFVNSFNSTSAPDSFFKLFSLIMTFYVAFGLAVVFLNIKSSKYMTNTLLLLLFGSILYIVFLPDLGLMTASDDFEYTSLVGERQGVFKHKNIFGGVSAFSFLYAFFYLRSGDSCRKLLLLLSALCLFLSNSATKIFAVIAIVLFVYSVFFLARFVFARHQRVTIYFSIFSLILLVFGAVTIADSLLVFAGRDLTFTGRTVIWEHAIAMAWDRIFFGYGLSSIWGTDLGYIQELPYFIPAHSHNSFVESLLTSGVVGLCLLILFIMSSFEKFSTFMASNDNSKFFLSVFLLALIDSFFEYTLFRGNSVLFLLAMFSMFLVSFTNGSIASRV